MKIVRFQKEDEIFWGETDGHVVIKLKGDPFLSIQRGNEDCPLSAVSLLPPVVPSKIILVGLNYIDHAKELGMLSPKEPIIFLKPTSSLLAHGKSIAYPDAAERLDYEAELAVVMARTGRNIPENDVGRFIYGYTCLNDVTARDIQKRDGQWTRAKSFDTFCPLGPWIETDFDPGDKMVTSRLNGEVRQSSSTKNFIFSIPEIVSFISRVMTLNPGDVISTGTPPGVGEMNVSDVIEVEVEGIGTLKNSVVSG